MATAAGLAGCAREPDGATNGSAAGASDRAGGAAPVGDPSVGAEQIEAAIAAADMYFSQRDLPKAEAILAKLIEAAPHEVRARELLGQVLLLRAAERARAGDEEGATRARAEAYEEYRAAVAAQPRAAGLQHSAGVVAMTAGRPDDALEHFRAARRLDPASPQHPLFEAQILIERGDLEAAAAALDAVLRLDPDEPVAHASLAIVAMNRGDHVAARARIAEARAIAPADLRFRVQEARIIRRGGDPGIALELLTGLPPRERAGAGVTRELAACHMAIDDPAGAARAWEHRFRSRPVDPEAWRAALEAARAHHLAGEPDAAARWLDRARLLAPSAPEVRELERRLADE